MTVHNMEVAEKFNRLANLLEIEGANPFRVRAYRTAARVIGSLSKNVSDLIAQEADLTVIPGIGKDLAEKIATIVRTGNLPLLIEVESRIPALLNELMKIEGLGPKRIQIIYKQLKIKTMKDLKAAILKGKLSTIKGFGPKIEQKILQGIQRVDSYGKRIKLADVFPIVDSLIGYLKKVKEVIEVECAGSFRRRKETIGDLDIVASGIKSEKIIDAFVKFEEVDEVLSKGGTRSTIRLHSGVQVDLRVVEPKSYGAALLYFTGSKDHNIAIRRIAVKKKLKINEYGVFKGKKQMAGVTEEDIYRQIKLDFIEPELREERGEIEAAGNHTLPNLVTLEDIRGDLHCHTNTSTDSIMSLTELVKMAERLGYDYVAVSDHSKHLPMVKGLDKKKLLKEIKKIDQLNEKLGKCVVLKSIEVDILEDGSLDLPDEVLKALDFTVGSIHSFFNLPAKKQTDRIIRAMDNPYVNIIGHPTGRIINERAPYAMTMERVMIAAKERGCILELNAQPERLDLNEFDCKMAKEIGVKVAISTDAHNVSNLQYMKYGVFQARRGWLEKSDVVNTLPLDALRKLLRR